MSEEHIARRIIFVGLECLYCLASTDFAHPNRKMLEEIGGLETALECCNVMPGDLHVFKWACTLLAMLYSRRIAISKSNGKICRIMMELLARHAGDIGISEYGFRTLSFVSFVSVVVELGPLQESLAAAVAGQSRGDATKGSAVVPLASRNKNVGMQRVPSMMNRQSTAEYLWHRIFC